MINLFIIAIVSTLYEYVCNENVDWRYYEIEIIKFTSSVMKIKLIYTSSNTQNLF